ncbi:hypothetical protein MMC21_002716, partial [Puttea exsequens]|nr:hypothetical protein [Puttea exsequens]
MAHPRAISTFTSSGNRGLDVGYNSGNVNAHFHPPAERPETPPNPKSTIPFRRDPDFVDRGTILDQLHEKCALPASRTALVGLGGVGKSQLAIEYGYRIREQLPETWVFWVHAGSTARLEQSYRDIAEHVKISGRKEPKANIFKLVYEWLCGGGNRKWLFVLDNIDHNCLFPEAVSAGQGKQKTDLDGKDLQSLLAYLPQSQNGWFLITSRSRDVALKLVENKDIITVEPMAKPQALALFEKKLGVLGNDKVIAELAVALEFMPLAIVQAAAYISRRAPRYSMRQFLEDFRKSDHKKTSLLNFEGGHLRRDLEAKNSIIITWQISFEHIQRSRSSAADLLSLMSFFDRQGIPEVLVRSRARTGIESGCTSQEESGTDNEREDGKKSKSVSSEEDGFEDDIQILRDYSFISVETNRTFEMHALVQLATRKWLEASGQLEKWKQQYIRNLSVKFPVGEYENWTRCQALFPHAKSAITQQPRADGSLREWALLLHNAAWYAWRKGSVAEAIQFSRGAMGARKKILGQEHKETLSSMAMVGVAYSLGGRWDKAEELEVQVMETTKRVLGEEHPSTLSSIANLASTYRNQGRWKEAEELDVQVMKTRKRVLGEEHPDTLSSIANL